ncbi:MAG: peptidase domain-containing ABC transporter [Ignavibacteria bacterium]|nr:peptidase domain-containing ABC transporter [Ignavibacteria bacterium]MCU7517034.1 peptidase domain-containing ABC transporter [Ignavibacteria bacterium]
MLKILRKRFPLVRQYDQIDCGPACLLSILKYYSGNTSLVHMRELCNTGTNGSTMFDVINAAKEIGFDAFGAEGEYEDLEKEAMPCIAHLVIEEKLNHFVVIYKIDKNRVFIADPGKGRYYLAKEEFLRIWKSRSVVLLKPDRDLMNLEAPVWYKWIMSYIHKEDTWVYQSLFLGIIYTIISLLTSVFVQMIIDKYIPEQKTWKVLYTGLLLLILLGIKVLAGFFRQRFLVELNNRISLNINADFISHIFKLPKKFFDTRKAGDITSRINDAIKIQQSVLQITGTTAIDILIITASFILIFQFSSVLAGITLCMVPIYLGTMIYGALKLKKHQREVMKNYSLVEASYIDTLNGIDEIISYSSSDYFSDINRKYFRNFQEKIKALGLTQSNLAFVSDGLGVLGSILLLTLGSVMVINKELMLGQMMGSFTLYGAIMPSINRMVDSIVGLQGASIASQRLMDLFLVKTENASGTGVEPDWKGIELKNAGFGWNNRNPLFKDVNMQIPKGLITALYGKSGSGKSTIVQILQRKYELTEGCMFYNNIDAGSISLDVYRKKIAVVPQNIKIFNGTLLENILMGRNLPSVDELNDRIKLLGFDDFFKRFEWGYFTILGEDGRHLSGGEKQVIALVRALFDKPDLLIIDEGLSGLDHDLEAMIFARLKDYSKDHGVFIITHNTQILGRCEHIYRLGDGKIRIEGNPLINNDKQKAYETKNIGLN